MKIPNFFLVLILLVSFNLALQNNLYSGFLSPTLVQVDTDGIRGVDATSALMFFFDLRDRESYIQLTYTDLADETGATATAHVQIFDVSNLCNENDFFDTYTVSDTHVYNIRNILTNDGDPSGVQLPDNSYGIVVITLRPDSILGQDSGPIGNMRILDSNGYEYRTNGILTDVRTTNENLPYLYSFNFNSELGISLSDIVGITLYQQSSDEWTALPVQAVFNPMDVDIVNNNEVLFSCRDIIFACVNEDNPLIPEILSNSGGSASVASFEYGINDSIPHSRGGELLCPGNIVTEGAVLFGGENIPITSELDDLLAQLGNGPFFFGFVGLNNGNSRGSLDSFFTLAPFTD